MKDKNEIIVYQAKDLPSHIEVLVENETVWLSKEQMATLFGRDRTVISRHISNIFKEGELLKEVVCAFFARTTHHGAIKGKTQTSNVEFFNLDVIISVGYRVKSRQGTQFRIWANKVLKDYLLKGYALNSRMNRIEDNVQALSEKVNEIDIQINAALPPKQGIFFNGEVFDAWQFVSDLVRSAKESIVLIDNYLDDSVLALFAKRDKGVSVVILTKKATRQMELDVKKFNEQYPPVSLKEFSDSHDRFLIIDQQTIYHIGASLKDLGKKWFAFSKMDIASGQVLSKVEGLG